MNGRELMRKAEEAARESAVKVIKDELSRRLHEIWRDEIGEDAASWSEVCRFYAATARDMEALRAELSVYDVQTEADIILRRLLVAEIDILLGKLKTMEAL